MSNIYENLEHMMLLAVHLAKEHGCNYNIILFNPNEEGEFDKSFGSTYEMVMDSYFEKTRPNVSLLFRTDDLIRVENLQEGDVIAFGFDYNGKAPSEVVVDKITAKRPGEFLVHFLYGHHSLAEWVRVEDVLAIGDPEGPAVIHGWTGKYRIVNHNSKLLRRV